jgi:hypothetical protein
MSLCKIRSIHESAIRLESIDAYDETPVLDLLSYIPGPVGAGTLRPKPLRVIPVLRLQVLGIRKTRGCQIQVSTLIRNGMYIIDTEYIDER